jgi:hypothetical protein
MGHQRANPECERDEGYREQEPRDDLMPGQGGPEPDVDIEKKQSDDELPRKETIEAVRTRRAEGRAGDIDEQGGQRDEGDQLIQVEHAVHLDIDSSFDRNKGNRPDERK